MAPAKKDEARATPPDAPDSVGWTEAQTKCLVSRRLLNGP
jgi:hypothetical protein